MSKNKAVIAWESTGKKGYALVAERILDLKNKGNTLCGEIERLEAENKRLESLVGIQDMNDMSAVETSVEHQDKIKKLEAQNTKLRNAATLALEVISRSGDTTSSCGACVLTLKAALEGK